MVFYNRRTIPKPIKEILSMLEFLANNISTIVVGMIVLGIVILVIKSMYNDKKSGKSSCGGGCSGCPNACMCHSVDAKSNLND